MIDAINQPFPKPYRDIEEATAISGFTMASDIVTCGYLRTLAASKPSGKFLELGTGTGLSTSWILDGMDENSTLISIDHDPVFLKIARDNLGTDSRINIVVSDGDKWIMANLDKSFDYIFADTWHGKYLLLDEILSMLNKGGLYIIDDMLRQANWPEGHDKKVEKLIVNLESRNDLLVTKQNWATGLVVAVKR